MTDDKQQDDRPFHVCASDALQRNNSNEPYAPDDLNGPPLTPQERNKRRPRETEAQLLERIRNDKYDTRPFHIRIGEAWGFPVESDHAAQMMIENKNPDGTPFDYRVAFEQMRRDYPEMFINPRKAPKLTHEGHCEVYACLYYQIPQYVVAKAFDITPATVSTIARCRSQNMNRKGRYAKVEAEYDSLGEAEFMRHYFTDRVQAKIMRVKAEIKNKVWLD
jgi:hypothetical protein